MKYFEKNIFSKKKFYIGIYSAWLSRLIRQPVESFFNWLNEKTKRRRKLGQPRDWIPIRKNGSSIYLSDF